MAAIPDITLEQKFEAICICMYEHYDIFCDIFET